MSNSLTPCRNTCSGVHVGRSLAQQSAPSGNRNRFISTRQFLDRPLPIGRELRQRRISPGTFGRYVHGYAAFALKKCSSIVPLGSPEQAQANLILAQEFLEWMILWTRIQSRAQLVIGVASRSRHCSTRLRPRPSSAPCVSQSASCMTRSPGGGV